MFLNPAHKKTVFEPSKRFVLECYRGAKSVPSKERFAAVQRIRRAALPGHLNMAEGCFRKPEPERKRYFEVSRSSVVEADAAVNLALELQYKSREPLQTLGFRLVETFKQLTGLPDE